MRVAVDRADPLPVGKSVLLFIDDAAPLSLPLGLNPIDPTADPQARFDVPGLSAGPHEVRAEFGTQGNFRQSAATLTQTVAILDTTTTISSR